MPAPSEGRPGAQEDAAQLADGEEHVRRDSQVETCPGGLPTAKFGAGDGRRSIRPSEHGNPLLIVLSARGDADEHNLRIAESCESGANY
jgi:hypothetical protein